MALRPNLFVTVYTNTLYILKHFAQEMALLVITLSRRFV